MKENVLFLYNVINDKYIKFSFYKLLYWREILKMFVKESVLDIYVDYY